MPVFAEIHDGVVVNLVEAEHTDALPGLIDAADAQIGDMWNGERFSSPAVDMVALAKRLITDNNAAYESAIAALTAGYPPSEIATWERQRAEALAWAANSSAPTPWIDIAAATRGIERTLFLGRTHAKAEAFAQVSAYLTGLRQRYDDAIRTATPEQLQAIVIDYALPVSA